MNRDRLLIVSALLGAGCLAITWCISTKTAPVESAERPLSASADNQPPLRGAAFHTSSGTRTVAPGQSAHDRDLDQESLRRWTATDPRAAAAWASGLRSGDARKAITTVAITWANRDLSAASEWARRLADREDCEAAMATVAYEAARTDPVAALKLALELPPGAARDDLVTHATAQWAASEPQAAADWAGQIADEAMRERVLSVIATVWGDTDPAVAADFAMEKLPPSRAHDDAVIGIVQRWVQTEPNTASAWVAEFPDGTLRQTAIEVLVELSPTTTVDDPPGSNNSPQ